MSTVSLDTSASSQVWKGSVPSVSSWGKWNVTPLQIIGVIGGTLAALFLLRCWAYTSQPGRATPPETGAYPPFNLTQPRVPNYMRNNPMNMGVLPPALEYGEALISLPVAEVLKKVHSKVDIVFARCCCEGKEFYRQAIPVQGPSLEVYLQNTPIGKPVEISLHTGTGERVMSCIFTASNSPLPREQYTPMDKVGREFPLPQALSRNGPEEESTGSAPIRSTSFEMNVQPNGTLQITRTDYRWTFLNRNPITLQNLTPDMHIITLDLGCLDKSIPLEYQKSVALPIILKPHQTKTLSYEFLTQCWKDAYAAKSSRIPPDDLLITLDSWQNDHYPVQA